MSADLQRFGKAVLDRRVHELDRTQANVAEHGGPSTTTLTKIEAGLPPEPSAATLRRLDAGLDWEPGSARALLYNGTPPKPRLNGGREPIAQPQPLAPRLGGGPLRRLLLIREELDLIIAELRGE